MSQNIKPTNPEQNIQMQAPDDEINLLEYLLVIVKHKKMIFLSCVMTFVLACGITLLMPNIYTSTARILPPQDDSGGLNSMLGNMGGVASLVGISVGHGSGDLYAGMLKSRSISDVVIDKFNLMAVYKQNYRVKTYEALSKVVNISVDSDSGILGVTVEDEDPQRAADMANTYVEELQKLNVQLNLSSAGRERLFLEDRLRVVKADLAKAENVLKIFQEQNKAIRIDAQATAIIEAIAALKGELASKEIQLGVLQSSQTDQNPQVIALREGIAKVKEQIAKMEQSPKGKKVSGDIFMATSEVPELGIQYARLMRNFKVQETLYELLVKQYEVAKINEAKNTSTIQILDAGVVADKKSKPKRGLIVILSTFMIAVFTTLYAFIIEFGQRLSEEDRMLWKEIKIRMKFRIGRKRQ